MIAQRYELIMCMCLHVSSCHALREGVTLTREEEHLVIEERDTR
jgi:hypothetical protein